MNGEAKFFYLARRKIYRSAKFPRAGRYDRARFSRVIYHTFDSNSTNDVISRARTTADDSARSAGIETRGGRGYQLAHFHHFRPRPIVHGLLDYPTRTVNLSLTCRFLASGINPAPRCAPSFFRRAKSFMHSITVTVAFIDKRRCIDRRKKKEHVSSEWSSSPSCVFPPRNSTRPSESTEQKGRRLSVEGVER